MREGFNLAQTSFKRGSSSSWTVFFWGGGVRAGPLFRHRPHLGTGILLGWGCITLCFDPYLYLKKLDIFAG